MHMKAVSWDHTPRIVPDQTLFSFSTSNFREVTAGTKLKPALRPPGKQDNPKSSASLLSNLFSPSVSKEAPPSMKLNLPKKSSRCDATFQSKLGHSNAISHTLYDDPAFSSDPHANPFFVTGHDGQISPPEPGHPTLKKDAHKRPTPPLTIPPIVRDSGEFRLIQPPNSPMSLNGPDTTTSFHDSTPPKHIDKPSKLTKASPTAAQSHSVPKNSIPAKSEEQSRPLTEKPEKPEKKRNTLGMFWRKSPPTSPADKSAGAGESKQSGGDPPPYETIFSHPPASVAVASAETQQSFDMASFSSRSSPASADSPLYPGPLHPALGKSSLHLGPRHPAVAKHRKRKNKLDRIDELDESNPLGIAVHHGGPYEAIQRLVQKAEHSRRKVPHNVGSQYATPTSSQNSAYNVHGSSLGTFTPSGVSLNLTPGQILPRGLDDYYNPYVGIKAPPVPHPQSNNRHRIYPAHMLSSQEPWDSPQQHRQDQVPRVSTSSQYPRAPQPSRPNEMAAQQFSPRPVESVPQTPRQTLPRDRDNNHNPYPQPNGGMSVPRPSNSQFPLPSQKPNSQERWAPQWQDRQEQIPLASAFAQHPPHITRRNDMSAQYLAQHTVQTVPSTQERWLPQQQRRKEEIPYPATPAQYPGPPHTAAPNHTAAQYLAPQLAETVPQTPQQTVPRDLINYSTLQSTGVLNVPQPSSDSQHRPSRSHQPNPQERWDPPQQRWQDEMPDISTPAEPSHSAYSNDMAAQYLAPRPVATVPPTPQQIVSRKLNDHNNSHLQPSGVNVPQPPSDSQNRPSPSRQPNSQGRLDSQQRRQDEIPYTSTPTQYPGPPQATRPNDMAVKNSAPRPVESVPRILGSSWDASVTEENNKPHQRDPHPSISEPPAPPAQISSDEHGRHDQSNKTRPSEAVRSNNVTPPTQSRQSRDRDAQSTQRTLASNGSTFNSRSGTKPQPPRHVPKKLIMPAPLQHSLPMPSRDQSHLHPLQHHSDIRRQQQHFPSRPSSPPSSLHPSFNSLMPRAQNIPMSQGRKLRKQGSVNGLPPKRQQEAAVSFPANVGYSDPAPAPKTKVPRRVLSKRRSDL